MYPSSGSRRLSRSQQTQPPRSPQPSTQFGQDMLGSQFMPGDPGGFVLPGGPAGNFSSAPLGFVLPGAPQSHGQMHSNWGGSAYPPMQPLSAGEPGGFIVPGNAYPRPQSPSYAPQGSHEQYAQRQVYPPHDTYSSVGGSQVSASRNIYSRQESVAGPRDVSSRQEGLRNIPSRQESVSSRHSAGSFRSAASSTMVNGYVYPKHSQQQWQHSHAQQPAYTWEDMRYGR